MSKLGSSITSNILKKSHATQMKRFLSQEKSFQRQIEKIILVSLKNPIEIFLDNYQLKKFVLQFKNPDDEQLKTYIIIHYLQQIKSKDCGKILDNIIDVIKEKNQKQIFAQFLTHQKIITQYLKKITLDLSLFQENYLQKKGKLFGGTVVRKCYITSSSFGQIKGQEKGDSNKSFYFQNFYVKVRNSNDVQNEINNKNKGVLPWSKDKNLKTFKERLDLTDLKSNYNISLYTKDQQQSQQLKNMIIYERINNIDPHIKKKFKQNAKIWKYLTSHYFYKNLKNFLLNKQLMVQEEETNQQIQYNVHAYCKEQQQLLNESDLMSEEEKQVKKQEELNRKDHTIQFQNDEIDNIDVFRNEIVIGDDDKLTASIIEKDYQTETEKKYELLKSQFYNITIKEDIEINQEDINNEKESIISNVRIYEQNPNVDYCLENHLFFLTVQKIVIDNIFQNEEEELAKILLQSIIKQGDKENSKFCFIENQNSQFISFNTLNSLTLNSQEEFQLIFKNEIGEEILLEQNLLITDIVKKLGYQEFYFFNFNTTIQEQEIQIKLLCSIALFPKNLEVAHTSLSKLYLDHNLENFKTFLTDTDNFFKWFKLFYPIDTMEDKIKNYNNKNILNHLDIRTEKMNLVTEFSLTNILFHYRNSDQFITDDYFNKILNDSEESEINFPKLLTPQDRLLLVRISQNFMKSMVNLDIDEKISYNESDIKNLTLLIEEFLQKQNLENEEIKCRYFNLVLSCYLIFSQNTIQENQLILYFSKNYLPIIYYSLLMNQILKDEQIIEIIIHDLLNITLKNDYSVYKNYFLTFKTCIIFKFYLSQFYPIKNEIIINKMCYLDDIIMDGIATLFIDYCNENDFHSYQDFKKLIRVYMLSLYLDELNKLQSVCDLNQIIDAIYIINTYFQVLEKINTVGKEEIPQLFKNELKNSIRNMTSQKFMTYFNLLQEKNFCLDELNIILKELEQIYFDKAASIFKIKQKVEQLEINYDQVQKWMTDAVFKSDRFTKDLRYYIDSEIKEDNQNIQVDPWFQICNELTEEFPKFLELQEEQPFNKIIQTIYQLHPNFQNSTKFNPKFFNGISNIDAGYFNDWFELLQMGNRDQELLLQLIEEIFNFVDSNSVSQITVLFFLNIFAQNKSLSLNESIQSLIFQINRKIGGNDDKLNSLLMCHFLQLIFILYPKYIDPFQLEKRYLNDQENSSFEILIAKFMYQGTEIDYKEKIQKEINTFNYLTMKKGFFFDEEFLKDVQKIITSITTQSNLKKENTIFDLILVTQNNGQLEYNMIPFKIVFGKQNQIFCLQTYPLYFERINSQQKTQVQNFNNNIQKLPNNFYIQYQAPDKQIFVSQYLFRFQLEYQKQNFLNVNVKFDIYQQIQLRMAGTIWNFVKNSEHQNNLLTSEFQDLEITLPYHLLFQKMGEVYQYIIREIYLQAEQENLFIFIKLHTQNFEILQKERLVNNDTYLLDLKSLDNLQDLEDKTIKFIVDYKF